MEPDRDRSRGGGAGRRRAAAAIPGRSLGRHIIGTPLILLGSAVSVISYRKWKGNQRALRRGEPLGRSRLPHFLAVTVAGIGLVAAAIVLLSALGRH